MRCLLSLLLSLAFFSISAQDNLATKMEWYRQAKSSPSLFVHFDKTIYSNNETVYFTGYLLKSDSISLQQHQVLSLALVRDADTTIISHEKFLMENGVAFGSIQLIDSILTGNYHFIAYTDKLVSGLPEALFVQPITMKTSITPFFNASMKVLTDKANPDNRSVLLSVVSRESRFLPKPTTVTYRYGKLLRSAKTDPSGQLLISFPEQQNIVDPNLYVKLKYGSDSSFISTAIPISKSKATVKFYPEGGNLVEGIPSTIGWEAKDQQHMPLSVKAFLYLNNQPIDTIETGSYGIGKFRLFPVPNGLYTVKLLHSALTDSTYTLPTPLKSGLVINLPAAVVSDTLRAIIKSSVSQKLILRIHNFKNCFLEVPFKLTLGAQALKIPLTEIPKGLVALTITDSLDRPLAERIFFAHYAQENKIQISTDKESYYQREKINLKINLANYSGQALVSIACAQNNRFDLRKTQDIASFTYLTSELSTLPVNLKGNAMIDQAYVEQILLVKGWRRYTWQELEQASPSMAAQPNVNYLKISGKVSHPKRKISQTNLVIVGGSSLQFLTTDSTGNFTLDNKQIITPAGNKLYLVLDHKEKTNASDYKIKINDSYQLMNVKLARIFDSKVAILPSTLQNNQDMVLKNNERVIQLKEVRINPNGEDDSMTYNACGDYYCVYNILNCKNHLRGTKGNKPARKGEYYLVNGIRTFYEGCNTPDESIFFKVKPIYLGKEFYIDDFKDPLEPAIASTIYWNHALILTPNKENQITFYTSDITGKFRIVIQGITNNDVVYAEKHVDVKAR